MNHAGEDGLGEPQEPAAVDLAGSGELRSALDGFEDAGDMAAWFEKTHGLPFEGTLIEWSPAPPGTGGEAA